MPDVKISGLPAGTVLSTSLVPAVSGGTTHQTTPLASTQAALTSLTINTGNSALAVGGATLAGVMVRATGSLTGASGVANTFNGDMTFAADVTNARIYNSNPTTANAVFTVNQLVGFRSAAAAKGASSTINTHIGFLADAAMSQATTSYAFYGDLAAGFNCYMAGLAPNYFNGRVGIGTTNPGSHLEVIPGTASTQGINCVLNGASGAVCYALMAQAAGATGANTGVYVNVLNGTVQNYGVRIVNPPAGVTNWAIYSDSAAQSYHKGNIGIGSGITDPTSPLDVGGNSIRIRTASTQATSAAAGNAGEIRWDDSYLYVRVSGGWRRVALGAAF